MSGVPKLTPTAASVRAVSNAAAVEDLVSRIIRDAVHPDITAIATQPSGPDGWFLVKVSFADGSAVYVGTAGKR